MKISWSCLFSNSKNSRALRSFSKCLEMKRNWDPLSWLSNLSSASVLVKRITLENFFDTIQLTKSSKNTSRCGPATRPDLQLLKWKKNIRSLQSIVTVHIFLNRRPQRFDEISHYICLLLIKRHIKWEISPYLCSLFRLNIWTLKVCF